MHTPSDPTIYAPSGDCAPCVLVTIIAVDSGPDAKRAHPLGADAPA
jgi:hypothetical protein